MNPTPTMIGSIARALASSYGDPDWTNHVAAARAVLAAMREPTPEMLTAALPDLPYWGDLAMEIHRSNDGSEIHLSGEVEAGDFEKFEAAAATAKNAIVSLASPGGLLNEGLRIGARIRERGFSTVVPDGAICASACGYIWLAGASRFVEGNGQVGFHAVYVPDNNLSISAPGNALVGSYMAKLGFNDRAIAYATEAGLGARN